MKSRYWADTIYKTFLNSLSSCTYVSYTDKELQEVLSDFAMRAIARFKFPQVSLAYEYDEEKADYFFIEEVTMREIDVIAA